MKEIKEAIFTKITSILATAGKSKVKIYPLNQVAPKAKRPYIEYSFTMVGASGKNERLALLDILLHASNSQAKQIEAEEIADLFTIEGLANGLENETVITTTNSIALEFRMINRSTPATIREKTKTISLTYDMTIIDKRSVMDPLLTP